MSSATISLTHKATYHKTKSKALSLPRITMPWKLLYLIAGLLAFMMLAYYIFMVFQLTKGAYVIKNDNQNIAMLSAQNRNLETSFAESDFLGSVQQKALALDFVQTAGVTYIQVLQNSLAIAK